MHPSFRAGPAITEEGLARIAVAGLKPEQLPRHIAIIMDGNGRWAQRRGLPRIVGHRRGIQSVRAVVNGAARRMRVCASCIRSGKVQKVA